MTSLPRALSTQLAAEVPFSTLEVITEREARDGTVKTLFRTHDGHPVEAVLMRYRDGRRSLVGPVVAYIVAIGTMLATAIGAGGAAGIAGAGLFFVSDAVIAETRFVRARAWGPLVVIVSYHLALAGLVFSLVR